MHVQVVGLVAAWCAALPLLTPPQQQLPVVVVSLVRSRNTKPFRTFSGRILHEQERRHHYQDRIKKCRGHGVFRLGLLCGPDNNNKKLPPAKTAQHEIETGYAYQVGTGAGLIDKLQRHQR